MVALNRHKNQPPPKNNLPQNGPAAANITVITGPQPLRGWFFLIQSLLPVRIPYGDKYGRFICLIT